MIRESLQYTTPITPAHDIAMANISSSSSSSAAPMLTESTVPQPPTPMLVGREGEQHKRGTSKGDGEAKKKAKEDQ
eukprot:5837834-Karenia_brevis.AAC.1